MSASPPHFHPSRPCQAPSLKCPPVWLSTIYRPPAVTPGNTLGSGWMEPPGRNQEGCPSLGVFSTGSSWNLWGDPLTSEILEFFWFCWQTRNKCLCFLEQWKRMFLSSFALIITPLKRPFHFGLVIIEYMCPYIESMYVRHSEVTFSCTLCNCFCKFLCGTYWLCKSLKSQSRLYVNDSGVWARTPGWDSQVETLTTCAEQPIDQP